MYHYIVEKYNNTLHFAMRYIFFALVDERELMEEKELLTIIAFTFFACFQFFVGKQNLKG